ncbi:hypothetical protein SKAU_G00257920 [Synaphobranchus kaupii]|uniref:Uncharacterized protein n=1 Tax=Synaphobranchus kaupii TaxID=118154 RepID=A0A9Q1ISK2_SYNKA|nr:hypothetical protein SKAU_G00257920 [Synaphobranchus kaupii]
MEAHKQISAPPLLVWTQRESRARAFPRSAIIERLPPPTGVASARETQEEGRISPRLPGCWVHACSLSPMAWPSFKSSCQLNWTTKTDSFFS